jgi:molybdate transport system permease protein
MVGGNIEGETRTVSIDIYDEVQALNYAAAGKTALFLLVISYAVLLTIYAINRRVWGPIHWQEPAARVRTPASR